MASLSLLVSRLFEVIACLMQTMMVPNFGGLNLLPDVCFFLLSYFRKTAPLYFKQLEKFKPEIIMAYPSSILLLAKFAKQTNWAPSWELNCVFTSSELFSKENQKTVKSVFGNVLDHYGQAERVAALQLCREGNYHVRQDYSIVEFIQNELGTRIVGSNVHNSAMPLTRYDTNDYVEGVNLTNQCSCGKPTPFVNRILGRDDDYVVLPNGNIVGRLDVAFKGMDSIAECQIEQVTIDELIVRYVPKDGINIAKIEMDLTQRLNERLGITANFEFIPLRNIPRTKAGKFRSVIRSKDIHCV
ncbi:phenylacetate--CoA ligase family protein [Vibrio alfacsensis]|uniref:Phenylacetate--CoA ligase family protein n=2 Tax=Vibrio alfacsensis TaxID=1074311 RepID=A0ABN5PI11_9VIBR|nr:phenylacetate--CoA ligase family protein [Vibrio alfacsensis]